MVARILAAHPFKMGTVLVEFFSSLAKSIMPLIKSGAKAIGKQALKGGLGFASDVLAGKTQRKRLSSMQRWLALPFCDRLQVVNAKIQGE